MAYVQRQWQTNELVTAEKLNHIEQGIYDSECKTWTIDIEPTAWVEVGNSYSYTETLGDVSRAIWVDVRAVSDISVEGSIEWETTINNTIVFTATTLPTNPLSFEVAAWGTTEGSRESEYEDVVVYDGLDSTEVSVALSARQGKILNDTKQDKLSSVAPLTVATGGTGGSTPLEARTNLGITPSNIGAIAASDVVDDLISTDTNLPLSANQGKILNEIKQDKLSSNSPLPISAGGTGATTAEAALENLGITASTLDAIPSSAKGSPNGVAELDANGKVPSSQIPNSIDNIEEYSSTSSFPATGDSGTIYVDTSTGVTYRWSGTQYISVSSSLVLGESSSTAYRGDRGAAAYAHAVTNKGAAFSSGLYKITTNAEGHVTAATAVTKADITGLGIPASDTTYTAGTGLSLSSGKFNLANTAVTAGSYGPSANATPAYGATFNVPYITVDAQGRITAASTKTIKIPASDNTDTHRPIQVNGTQILASNTTALNLKAGSNVTITNSSGTVTIAATNTTYSNFVKSGSGAKAGLVPSPGTTAGTSKFLREDGTWTAVNNTLTSTATNVPLSAAQGKELNSKITALTNKVTGATKLSSQKLTAATNYSTSGIGYLWVNGGTSGTTVVITEENSQGTSTPYTFTIAANNNARIPVQKGEMIRYTGGTGSWGYLYYHA